MVTNGLIRADARTRCSDDYKSLTCMTATNASDDNFPKWSRSVFNPEPSVALQRA